MSKYSHYYREYSDSTRPRAKSKLMGVCAGMARQFGWDVALVRIVAVLGLFTFTLPVLILYVVAGVLFY